MTGESPVVDIARVVSRRVVSAELIETLPTARDFWAFDAIIPGMQRSAYNRPHPQDVGGLSGQRARVSIHGGRPIDMNQQINGMPYSIPNMGGVTAYTPSPVEVAEFSYELGANGLDTATGGVHMNVIPKQGGNVFSGLFHADFTNNDLQSDNVTDELRARGLQTGNEMQRLWDMNLGVGGPIMRDKLWFFGSVRYWGFNDRVPDQFYELDRHDSVYEPDLSRPAIEHTWDEQAGLRVTWQATPRNKFTFFASDQHRCQCNWRVSASRAPEAAGRQRNPKIQLGQFTWTAPISNRVLVEFGATVMIFQLVLVPQPGFRTETAAFQGEDTQLGPDDVSITELSTGLNFRAYSGGYHVQDPRNQNNYRGAVSYITGSHALKTGFTLMRGHEHRPRQHLGDMNFYFRNGVPSRVQIFAPDEITQDLNAALGVYAQDQWTVTQRLTLDLGLRFDYLNASIPEQNLAANRFLGPRSFPAVKGAPSWTDLSPRVGIAYDLFGTGRTALKASWSSYLDGNQMSVTGRLNPVNATVKNARRSWSDLNGDFRPDCDFLDPDRNLECGPISNRNFGGLVIGTTFDDALRRGFGNRGSNWEATVGVQHEVMPGLGLNVAYYRRSYGNFTVTDNLEVTGADFDPFCITAPTDARLPGGGGNEICGLYDVTPAKFGLVDEFVSLSENFTDFGPISEVYDGVDVTVNGRLPRGITVGGGLNTGRTVEENCVAVDSPEVRFCKVSPSFLVDIKGFASVALPWDVEVAATLQNRPGPEITASFVESNANIVTSLGRNLASGGTKRVALIEPGTEYEKRFTQLDIRLAKNLRVGGMRFKGIIDFYNALNNSGVLLVNNQFGSAWQRPQFILPGRIIKFLGQVHF